jgi:hypothetical protein
VLFFLGTMVLWASLLLARLVVTGVLQDRKLHAHAVLLDLLVPPLLTQSLHVLPLLAIMVLLLSSLPATSVRTVVLLGLHPTLHVKSVLRAL